MNSNYMGVQKTRIQEYFEEIPFRQFTRKGVEIRDLEYIDNVSYLCKRKSENFINEVNKRRDVKFGEIDINKENELLEFFLNKIREKEDKILNYRDEIKNLDLGIFNLEEEIKKEESKAEVPILAPAKTEEERVFEMFEKHNPIGPSKTQIEKELKNERRLQKEDRDKVPLRDSIDVSNSNLEMVFALRKSIITVKKDFDMIVNSEIENIGLNPEELSPYRKSRLEEEVSKMKRYNDFIMYLRSTDPNNIYTKDLITMKFLRYQTLHRNANINLECSMEERMFEICLDRFESERNKREEFSALRYENRVNEAVDRGIIERRNAWDLKNKKTQNDLLKEFKKKFKTETKKENKTFIKPDLQFIKKKKSFIETKQGLIESLNTKIKSVEENIRLFTLQKKNIMLKGYNKEIIGCKREMIKKSVEIASFKLMLKDQLIKAEIVEVEDNSEDGGVEFINENVKYALKLMIRKTDKINEAYRNLDKKRYKKEMEEYLNGNKQIVKI